MYGIESEPADDVLKTPQAYFAPNFEDQPAETPYLGFGFRRDFNYRTPKDAPHLSYLVCHVARPETLHGRMGSNDALTD